MEVKGIGQGGQAAFNTSNANIVKSIEGQNIDVKTNTDTTVKDELTNNNIQEKDLKNVVDKLNKLLEGEPTHVEYAMHDKFKQVMIKIVDNKTGDVISELPPKKVIDMVAKLCELVGVLVDKKA